MILQDDTQTPPGQDVALGVPQGQNLNPTADFLKLLESVKPGLSGIIPPALTREVTVIMGVVITPLLALVLWWLYKEYFRD